MLEGIFGKTIGLLEKALNVRLMQHDLLASDLANADTPGYKEKHLDFRATMASCVDGGGSLPLERTEPGHLAGGDSPMGAQVRLVSDPGPQGADGNTVNADTELVRLGENGLLYNATVEALARDLAILKQSVEGS